VPVTNNEEIEMSLLYYDYPVTSYVNLVQGVLCGKHFFIGCSGWQPDFASGHRSHPLPDFVDEKVLSALFVGGSLVSQDEMAPYNWIVSEGKGNAQEVANLYPMGE
jgi:hypothetical protein